MMPFIAPQLVMQISLKYRQSRIEGALHSVLLQVLAELNYGVEGVGSLDGVGVVGDDDGLGSLESDDALFSLGLLSVLEHLMVGNVWHLPSSP